MEEEEKIDEHGIIYEKGWDGQYRPKQGLFGPVKDTNLFGQPNIERGWFNNYKEAKDGFGHPIQSIDGENLYEKRHIGSGGGGSGGGGGEGIIIWIVFAILGFAFYVLYKIIVLILKSTQKGFKELFRGSVLKAFFYFLPAVFSLIMGILGFLYLRGSFVLGSTRPIIENEHEVLIQFPELEPSIEVTQTKQQYPVTQTPKPSSSEIRPTLTATLIHSGYVVVIKESVNLRAGPGLDFKVVGYARKGDIFKYFNKEGEWFQIDPVGDLWVSSAVVEIITEKPDPVKPLEASGFAVVVPNSVFLRASPGKNYEVVGYAYKGDQLPVYGRNAEGTWLQVDQFGHKWIATSIIDYDGNLDDLPILPAAVHTPMP